MVVLQTATPDKWNDEKRHKDGLKCDSDEENHKYNSKIPKAAWSPFQYAKRTLWNLDLGTYPLSPPPPPFRKMRPHLPIHTPVQSLKSRKSQNMCGNEANRPNTLAKKQKMTRTGLRPILSDNSPPTIAPTSHPPKTREVERELRIALSQTRSN